ncbi:hypothetical protein [Streptomyces sp. NPDC003877]
MTELSARPGTVSILLETTTEKGMHEVHTDIAEVGRPTAARARRVVISHLAPAHPAQLSERPNASGLRRPAPPPAQPTAGDLAVGHDLMRISLD